MKSGAYQLSAADRLDLINIWIHLAENASPDRADQILADIELGIGAIVKKSSLGHPRPDQTKRSVLFYRVHSYMIIYHTHLKPLHILRLLHGARDIKKHPR